MRASDAIDALVMALDSPLLDGLDVSQRLHLTGSDGTPWKGLSTGEQTVLAVATALEVCCLVIGAMDDRLAVLAAEALTALADEAIR